MKESLFLYRFEVFKPQNKASTPKLLYNYEKIRLIFFTKFKARKRSNCYLKTIVLRPLVYTMLRLTRKDSDVKYLKTEMLAEYAV